MQSMKLTDTEKKDASTGVISSAPASEYPWGLNIHLDESSLQKLGMKKLPAVGDVMDVSAKIKIVSVGSHEVEGQAPNRSVDMQITDMEIGGEKTSDEKAKKLFGLEKGHSGTTASEGDIS